MGSPLVFLSYAREDEARVRALGEVLRARGFRPWIDVKDILPGQRWRSAITSALESASFILVCLSRHSVSKRGFAQREIRRAIDAEEEMLDGDIYLLPIRLDHCEVPSALQPFQWVDAFSNAAYPDVLVALVEGCRRRKLELGVLPDERDASPEPPRSHLDLSMLGGTEPLRKLDFRNWKKRKP
jgi:TIR domain